MILNALGGAERATGQPSKRSSLVVVHEDDRALRKDWSRRDQDFDLAFVDVKNAPSSTDPVITALMAEEGTRPVGVLLCHVRDHPEVLDDYGALWAPGSSVKMAAANVGELLRLHLHLGFGLATPAVDRSSTFALSVLVQHEGFLWRETDLIDPDAVVWTAGALRAAAEWRGVDAQDQGSPWVALLRYVGQRMAVYDVATAIKAPLKVPDPVADRQQPVVLRAAYADGAAVPLIDLSQRLTEGFPHAAKGQVEGSAVMDHYGLRHRRGLLRVAASQWRVKQVLADVQRRPSRRSSRRNLVFLRAGNSSLHPRWFTEDRTFDLVVDAHGSDPLKYEGTCDELFTGLAPTGSAAIHRLFTEYPEYLTDYDAIWLPDDDIETTTETINMLFTIHRELGFDLAQPALSTDSFYSFSFLVQHSGFSVREVNFIEPMVPLFARDALAVCLPTLAQSGSGWGLDGAWPALLRPLGGRAAVYDCLPVRHTRRVGHNGAQGTSRDGAVAELVQMVERYDSPHLQFNEVHAGWDLDFNLIEHSELARALVKGYPRTHPQAPYPREPYLENFLNPLKAGVPLTGSFRRSQVPTRPFS